MTDENETNFVSQHSDSDEALCAAARSGDVRASETLIHRYTRLVKACARPCFIAGADGDDIIQEGMIGLLKAIQTFDAAKGASFAGFARLCVTRQIYSAVRAAATHKHEILNHSLSIEKPLFDDNAEPHVPESISDPESLVIGIEEQQERIRALLQSLSIFEAKVLRLYLQGCSYQEMAERLHKPLKVVDNAIQRIRRKSAARNP